MHRENSASSLATGPSAGKAAFRVSRMGEEVGMSETEAQAEAPETITPKTAPCVAMVTGSAAGIGAAIARRLVRNGWQVLCLDRNETALDETCKEIGPGAHPMVADVADEAAVTKAIEVTRVHFHRLDALVCNAGMMIRRPIAQLTLDDFRRVIDVNLTSTFLLARAAEDLLRAAAGAILTIASTRAHMSEPDTESYAASKGGLLALSHALAISLGPDVRVNVISPGWIDVTGEPILAGDHDQHPVVRVGRPDDVASLAAWLIGPDSGFVTGAEFVIDGGMTRKMNYLD